MAALKLRLDVVTADSTCTWAQGPNLQAMEKTLREASALAGELEENAWRVGPNAG